MNEKGLSQLPSPVKIFIVSYSVLVVAGMFLSLWIVLKSPILRGTKLEEQYPAEMLVDIKDAQFYSNLKLAHIHHLGHVFIVFSLAGMYAFTRGKNSTKTQVIVWTAIATLVHTLAFLIYSRTLLIAFGSAYGILIMYMLLVVVIDCYRPVRAATVES